MGGGHPLRGGAGGVCGGQRLLPLVAEIPRGPQRGGLLRRLCGLSSGGRQHRRIRGRERQPGGAPCPVGQDPGRRREWGWCECLRRGHSRLRSARDSRPRGGLCAAPDRLPSHPGRRGDLHVSGLCIAGAGGHRLPPGGRHLRDGGGVACDRPPAGRMAGGHLRGTVRRGHGGQPVPQRHGLRLPGGEDRAVERLGRAHERRGAAGGGRI